MDKTLVIVDMQEEFSTANEGDTVRSVCDEVIQARKDGSPIIVLEFREYGDTLKPIMDKLEGYRDCYFTSKSMDDGSSEVSRLVDFYNLPQNFRVCGVNFAWCVRATIFGLMWNYPKGNIQIPAKACNCNSQFPLNKIGFYKLYVKGEFGGKYFPSSDFGDFLKKNKSRLSFC